MVLNISEQHLESLEGAVFVTAGQQRENLEVQSALQGFVARWEYYDNILHIMNNAYTSV